MTLVFYNSLTRKRENFVPLREKEVRIYSCGPTVYDYAHIGHARTYSVWDTLCRYLEYIGFSVYHVQNITDVGHLTGDSDFGEDKIIKRALEKNMEPMVLVERMIHSFFKDMDEINVRRADIHPRASAHIPEIIEVVKKILERGYAYEANGSVYFDVVKYMKEYKYPEFVSISLDEMERTDRIPDLPEKRNVWDFALWKKADPHHILQWPSPWGYGYPGWHIECTVMGAKYLGEEFDIHCGGEDLKFPHHANERAQAFAAFGKGLARYWLHSGFVRINGEKMSKSTGNFVYLKDAIKEWGGQVVRFWVISAHYRKQMDYSRDTLNTSKRTLESLLSFVFELEEVAGGMQGVYGELEQRFTKAMNNDLDTTLALKALLEFKNRFYSENLFSKLSEEELREVYSSYVRLGGVLGLRLDASTEMARALSRVAPDVLKILLEVREELRKREAYDLSDRIRSALSTVGIDLVDSSSGTKVRLKL